MMIVNFHLYQTLHKKCPYSELFWSVFSCIGTEYGEILRNSPYSVRMRENTDQNNSEYGHFPRSKTRSQDSQKYLRWRALQIYNFCSKAFHVKRFRWSWLRFYILTSFNLHLTFLYIEWVKRQIHIAKRQDTQSKVKSKAYIFSGATRSCCQK